jgi:hypothetical protein
MMVPLSPCKKAMNAAACMAVLARAWRCDKGMFAAETTVSLLPPQPTNARVAKKCCRRSQFL